MSVFSVIVVAMVCFTVVCCVFIIANRGKL